MRVSKNFFSVLLRDPYRFFFPLGILLGFVGIGHWLFYSHNWIPSYSQYFHSSLQMQGYVTCFIVGFLLTAMPRFASAHSTTKVEFFLFLILIGSLVVFLSLGIWVMSQILFIVILLALAWFAANRFFKKGSSVSPPTEFVWIPMAILHGVMGNFILIGVELFHWSPLLLTVAKPMSEQGFVMGIIIGVGGFLAPRLMGTYQLVVKKGDVLDEKKVAHLRRRRMIVHLGLGAVFFTSFWIEGFVSIVWGYALRAIVISIEFFMTCSWLRLPVARGLYAYLVWISLWLILTGSWSVVFFPAYRSALLHIVFVGGISLMIFSVATMVVLSHAGKMELLEKPLGVLKFIALTTFLVIFFRLLAVNYPQYYFHLLGAASTCWLLMGIGWLIFAGPFLIISLSVQESESCHERAKKRILKQKLNF